MKRIIFTVVIAMACAAVNAQVKVGEPVPEISLPNVNDSTVNLSSFKGKVVLIDFWASWCGPCRASNPSVVKLYNKYKDKGFEVFGVSIDNKKNDWLKAIKHDKIKYTQVNDKGGWYGKVPERYGINMIPTSILLDKEGKVVAIDAEGKQLDKLVGSLL
ncbi:TlpA family protein disulfide reductase [Ferruginibacter sp.]